MSSAALLSKTAEFVSEGANVKGDGHGARVDEDRTTLSPVVVSWSGGKDSALALWVLRGQSVPLKALLTTVTETFERISMHGVRIELLRQQAASVGLPLVEVRIPPACSNDLYEERMHHTLTSAELRDCEQYAFGDLFLEDVRRYREERLGAIGKCGIWPLWGADTSKLASEFIDNDFRAVIVCVDPNKLDPAFCGRDYDRSFLDELPSDVDPCGERGEFHTFVYDGPVFRHRIDVRRGETVERDRFFFSELLPG